MYICRITDLTTTDLYEGQPTDNLLKFWETIEGWINLLLPHDRYLKAFPSTSTATVDPYNGSNIVT